MKYNSLTGVLAIASMVSLSFASFIPGVSAAPGGHVYSTKLTKPYSAGCAKTLQAKGKSAQRSQQICQCSLGQMQQRHSQTEAIGILIKARYLSAKDPRTGMPTPLTSYFTPCL